MSWGVHCLLVCTAPVIYVIQCRFANVFFIPLKIFQNHIMFMTDSTTGTTSAKSCPEACICLTCGEGTRMAINVQILLIKEALIHWEIKENAAIKLKSQHKSSNIHIKFVAHVYLWEITTRVKCSHSFSFVVFFSTRLYNVFLSCLGYGKMKHFFRSDSKTNQSPSHFIRHKNLF
jgi:hypothetical protein